MLIWRLFVSVRVVGAFYLKQILVRDYVHQLRRRESSASFYHREREVQATSNNLLAVLTTGLLY